MIMTNLLKQFFHDFDDIHEYYNCLVEKTKKHQYVGITNEWLIDNFYLLVEHKTNIVQNKKKIKRQMKKLDTIFLCVRNIVISNHYNLNFRLLVHELKKYQKETKKYFSYLEISHIKNILLFLYTNRLQLLCKEESLKLVAKDNISQIIHDRENKSIELRHFLKDDFVIEENQDYIFELNYQLKELGAKSNKIFKELNEFLNQRNISLKELINDEYQKKIENDLLISNIFNDLKEFFEFSYEDLFEKVSKTESILLEDEIYKKMTIESKDLYRKKLIQLAKKRHCTEVEYLENLLSQADRDDYHIGNLLFQKKNYQTRTILYLLTIFLFTIIVSYFLSGYFLTIRILGFFLLLIPISQLCIQILEQIFHSFVPTCVFPKLDYSKGIPKESSTMVVIPTIVSSKEKIKKMFDVLETFYLINRTDNLYFTLLGDVQSSDQEYCSFDQEICDYGISYATSLNQKYKKDLFYFLYRKRIWNEHENCYLGYERKRGALLHFNQILLHRFDKNLNEKYFQVNMLENHSLDIQYVITLDSDTRLVLNTALNLVGAMAHPMNAPILNKEKTKVIRGYALMQPRISVDIEATNRSLYSQVFAGIGGFDTYSTIVPNMYQDVFGEGNFVGKGIYHLKTFEDVLENTFPDNRILSHDLLEGNYLRCGYVCDIELIDDFPSKFLVDVTRHHRWARGDVQILSWIFPYVKNKEGKKVKNPISLLGKFKILDNVLRMFLPLSLFLILFFSFLFSKVNPLWWIGFVILEIALPILFFLRSKIYRRGRNKTTVYYKNLFFGGKSLLFRSYLVFADLAFYVKLYLDAFFRTMYRLIYSHKNLLNWTTAEEVEKTAKNTLGCYLRNFFFSFVCSFVFILLGIFTGYYSSYVIAFVFFTAPFALYYVSRDISHHCVKLKDKEVEDVFDIAFKTWNYFHEHLCSEYHYLIPDNYQENREQKLDLRASPTGIGFSLLSVVSAYELNFIDKDEAIFLIHNILKTVSSLEKWHGHLYNWYDIKTKKAMYPFFVSTIDSGNFVASMIVVREFLASLSEDKLVKLCDKIIQCSNFKKLYTKKDVFSIGYDQIEGKLSIYHYNKFASESRLTSYLAICLGDAPTKHWFCLDKSLTTYKGHKGLISWSGTSFEYFMPLLFMKNYPNTLLDETYHFAKFCQQNYIESVSHQLPWGISESAYDELDNSLNYKYRAFSTPYLKAKEDKENRIVLSPYSSLMAMELFPEDVYRNILKFKKFNMLGKYGFYESYDYDNHGVVKAFFAHHQGMSLVGMTNYLKSNVIQNYFYSNVCIKTFDILLKEKVQIRTSIDMKMAKYRKYDYQKEKIENDIRTFSYISYLPEVSVLSNKKYCLLMNDRGNSFSRYRTLQLNRYRKVTEQDYGIFLYIKDLDTNYVFSNTYAPINKKPDKYEVVFASDKIKFLRCDGKISTKTEIVVTKDHHAEIRKITFKNESDQDKTLELTSYTEPILSENMDDISHRVFNNMFISSEYDEKSHSLIVKRKSRGDSNINSYMVMRLIIDDESIGPYSYETERKNFIGRGHTTFDPIGLDSSFSNYAGDNLDPIMSIRNRIVVKANRSYTVYLLVGFGRSREQIQDIIDSYYNGTFMDRAFKISTLMNLIRTKNLNLTGEEMRVFNIMLNYLYQTTRISVNQERMDLLRKNALGQSGLWKFGVSGDRPIISVEIFDISDLGFVFSILKCFEYYKNHSIFVDVIIINSESSQYSKIIKKEIDDELYRMYTLNSFYHTPGSVTVIDSSRITREDRSLLNMVPRLRFVIEDHVSLEDAVSNLQKSNSISDYHLPILEKNLPFQNMSKLQFDNGFAGFRARGAEYVIYRNDTPMPWVNVIANKNFGTIVTNNGCGYTYAYNSSEFKLTSWTNDMVVNDKSEGFTFNGKVFDPVQCRHGFGYTILESESSELKKEITEFVALDDTIKLYLIKLVNVQQKSMKVDIDFWINPTFGNFEEKTSRHILAEFMGNDNYLKMRNVYSINYGDVNVFMSSSEIISHATIDRILTKSISTTVSLDKGEERYLVFSLGCGMSDEENLALLSKYRDVSYCKKELKAVKDYWNSVLKVIEVKSPDLSFDYMINGWYLYQAISSRIMAKAGFYQVSGAFGYRDQLQDAMNIAMIRPDFAREQILTNAAHQFSEGDVLHWWHEKNRFGLRSRFKDDYLWLVYAVTYYVNITGDQDILAEKVPYIIGDSLSEYEHEKGIIFQYSSSEGTLLEHCIQSLQLAMHSLGRHHLPLMGGGDWNDGMNRVGIKGKGESVWLGFFLYYVIDLFVKLMRKYDRKFNVAEYVSFNEKLKQNLNQKAWDKNYYLRAFFDNGDKLGSCENNECKIDLISQSFSILSGVASKDRIQKVITAVEENLVDDQNKLIRLLTPPFSKSLNNPGYIMNYPKGIRENGGQYTHAVSWYLMALIKTGYYDRAYRYYQMINPINRSLTSKDVEKYMVEPYVIAADIYSSSKWLGHGGWTWYTGSAGWFYRVGICDILGLQKQGDQMKLVPKIPIAWDGYQVVYHYMDTTYEIKVVKSDKDQFILDGKKQIGNSFALINDRCTHQIHLSIKSS